MTTSRDKLITEAAAELRLLLRYCDEGVTIRRHNIERVLESLKKAEEPA